MTYGMSGEKIYDRVFLQIDEDLPKLIDNNSLWENQKFIDTYHDIRNQLVELIINIKFDESEK
jgi:hypothetical protein